MSAANLGLVDSRLIPIAAKVLAGDRLIVVGSNRQALSISPYTGELLGTVELPGAPAVAPVVAQEMLFVLTEDANLIAMR